MLADDKLNILDRVPQHDFKNAERFQSLCRELNLAVIPCVMGFGYSEGILAHAEEKATQLFSLSALFLPGWVFRATARADGPIEFQPNPAFRKQKRAASPFPPSFPPSNAQPPLPNVDCGLNSPAIWFLVGWMGSESSHIIAVIG